MDDFSDDSESGAAGTGVSDAVEDVRGARRGHPRKKRANHNELERRRRNYQKGTMADLREAIPILTNDKPSTVLTLTKAREYIALLEVRAYEQEQEIVALRRELKLGPSGRQSGGAAEPPQELRKKQTEALRRENEALRNRIADAERRAQKARAPPATAAAAAAEMPASLTKVIPEYIDAASASVDPSLLSVADKALAGQ